MVGEGVRVCGFHRQEQYSSITHSLHPMAGLARVRDHFARLHNVGVSRMEQDEFETLYLRDMVRNILNALGTPAAWTDAPDSNTAHSETDIQVLPKVLRYQTLSTETMVQLVTLALDEAMRQAHTKGSITLKPIAILNGRWIWHCTGIIHYNTLGLF